MVRKILKILYVLQEKSNKDRIPKLGKGYSKAIRLNPYNPLSYITLVIVVVVGIIMFGVVGFWNQTEMTNPFKWN